MWHAVSDSEMRGVYLKSIKSPAVLNKFKMARKAEHNMDVFSQVTGHLLGEADYTHWLVGLCGYGTDFSV